LQIRKLDHEKLEEKNKKEKKKELILQRLDNQNDGASALIERIKLQESQPNKLNNVVPDIGNLKGQNFSSDPEWDHTKSGRDKPR